MLRGQTTQPSLTPATSPNGISSARFFVKPTTSAFSDLCGPRMISQAVPTATADSVASTTMPDTRVTLPASASGSASLAAFARRDSSFASTLVVASI